MYIEHCIFLSWFTASPESHEQDGEKLTRVTAMRRATASGDPAMAFRTLPFRKSDPYRLLPIAGRAYRRRLNRANAISRCSTKRAGLKRPARNKSPADAEFLDQALVARFVRATQVVEQLAALAHHFEQSATRMVVLDVGLEMLGEVINALGQDRHLNLWRSGISGLLGIRLYYFGLAAAGHRHRSSFLTHGSAHQAGEVEDALGDERPQGRSNKGVCQEARRYRI